MSTADECLSRDYLSMCVKFPDEPPRYYDSDEDPIVRMFQGIRRVRLEATKLAMSRITLKGPLGPIIWPGGDIWTCMFLDHEKHLLRLECPFILKGLSMDISASAPLPGCKDQLSPQYNGRQCSVVYTHDAAKNRMHARMHVIIPDNIANTVFSDLSWKNHMEKRRQQPNLPEYLPDLIRGMLKTLIWYSRQNQLVAERYFVISSSSADEDSTDEDSTDEKSSMGA